MTNRYSDSTRLSRIAPIALVLIFGWSLPALAEKTVNAIEPIVISDDIMKRTTAVESAATGSEGEGTDVAASCDGSDACVDGEANGGGANGQNE